MIAAFAVLLVCQLAGEVTARALGLPVPGPVLGLVLLFVLLRLRDARPKSVPGALRDGSVELVGKGLLQHLSLLFVPAGVGVVSRFDVLGQQGLALAVALVGSSVIGILVSVAVFRLVARDTGDEA